MRKGIKLVITIGVVLIFASNLCCGDDAVDDSETFETDQVFPGYLGWVAGGIIGYKGADILDFSRSGGWANPGGVMFVASLCASIGSSTTVYIIGEILGSKTGSLEYTFIGGMAGCAGGIAIWLAGQLLQIDEDLTDGLANGILVVGVLLSPILATAGYNTYGEPAQRVKEGGLFMPMPMNNLLHSRGFQGPKYYKFPLMKVRF